MRKRQAVAFLVGALFLGVAFQNCAPAELVFEDIQKSEEIAFFNYPYKTAPKFYGNILLFQQESSIANLEAFTFVGTVSYLPTTANINYSIKIVDADLTTNNTICPQVDGSLSGSLGESTIQFDCTTSRVFKTMKIIMTLTAVTTGSPTTTIEKLYQK